MPLQGYLSPSTCFVVESAASWDALLEDLSARISAAVDEVEASQLMLALTQREKQGTTAMPEGVAFPHAMLDDVRTHRVAAAVVRHGVHVHGRRGKAVTLVFLLMGPRGEPWVHVRLLARLARICHTPGAVARLEQAADARQLYDRIVEEDQSHA